MHVLCKRIMKLLVAVLCFLVIHKSGKAKPVLTQQYNAVVFCDWDSCAQSCGRLNQVCTYETCFCGDENKEELSVVSQRTNSDEATIENYNDNVFCHWEKCVNSCNVLNMICSYSSCTCVDEYTNTDDGQVTVTVSTTETDVTESTTETDVTVSTTETDATVSTTETDVTVSTTETDVTVSTTETDVTVSTTEANATVSTTETDVTESTTEVNATESTTATNGAVSQDNNNMVFCDWNRCYDSCTTLNQLCSSTCTCATNTDVSRDNDNMVFCDWNRCYDSCTTLNQVCSSTCTCATNTAVVDDHPFVKTYMW